jgi:hypothetical protein
MHTPPASTQWSMIRVGRRLVGLGPEGHGAERQFADERAGAAELS